MIYTVTLNPSVDRMLTIEGFCVGGTFKATHSDCLPAGKGINVARVAATLGEPVAALGLVGQDAMPAFAATLAEQGIENRLVPVPGGTRISVTILDPVGHTETHLREPGLQPPVEALDRVRKILGRVSDQDWVVFAGSLPPGLPVDMYRNLIRLCADRGARTLFDANGPPLLSGVTAPPTLLKVNLFEFRMLHPAWQVVGRQAAGTTERNRMLHPAWDVSPAEILDAARDLQARGVQMVVVSLGKRGVIGLDPQGRAWSASTPLDRPVVDAVGSGDALGAGCVVALSQGMSFAETLRLGVACGAANTLVAGAGCCRLSDIDRLVARAIVTSLDDLSGLAST
jgi:1-phosphofructokinase family hexose kinase